VRLQADRLKQLLSKFEQKEYESCKVLASKILEIEPTNVTALKIVSAIHENEGNLKDAYLVSNTIVKLYPDDAESKNNFGNVLKKLGRTQEAKVQYKQALYLNPNYAEAYFNLGMAHCVEGDYLSGLKFLIKAKEKNNSIKGIHLLIVLLEAKISRSSSERGKLQQPHFSLAEAIKLYRPVEKELINDLTQLKAAELRKAPGPRFGNGVCSPDYRLFDYGPSSVKKAGKELIELLENKMDSEIIVADSFFNIFRKNSGIPPHNHLGNIDVNPALNFKSQKYSAVYYLAVGEQDTEEPGYLVLHCIDEKILPEEGLIVVFPAHVNHSAFYSGSKDRILIGINFYTL